MHAVAVIHSLTVCTLSNQRDGGEVLLDAFRDLGVDYVICSPGSEWPPLWEAFSRQKRDGTAGPIYIDCGHETLAVTMAAAYTQITGKLQVVLLHAGAGLAQGSMAITGARALETPMLVMSGESAGYGEAEFDPGSQWYRNLGVVGGAHRLIEPMVKWAQQVPSFETLYNSVIRAGEMAQRGPKGPTYLCVSMETLRELETAPLRRRAVPSAPRTRPSDDDIETVARQILQAKAPIISVLTAGPLPEAFEALLDLAELMAIPVVEGPGAFFGNFPKSNPLYAGSDLKPLVDSRDLILLVENATPWYPPSAYPLHAPIIAIGENPLKEHLVYQCLGAERYLEGDVASTLRLLAAALRRLQPDAAALARRRAECKAFHTQWRSGLSRTEEESSRTTITVPLLVSTLQRFLPQQTSFVDETIVHQKSIREHLDWDDPHTYFRSPAGLGQGLGYALGVKMALPERTVVVTIGDGTFMYNPVIPALAFAEEHQLPLLIVIMNNMKYGVMEELHHRFYDRDVSTSKQEDDYRGVHLQDVAYERAASIVGGFFRRVDTCGELETAIQAAVACVRGGRSAILNVIMPERIAF